jgi:hypothetical protein
MSEIFKSALLADSARSKTTPSFHADQLLSRKEAARFLGFAPQTLAVWACTGRHDLPFIKIGKRTRYRLADLQEFVRAHPIVGGRP